MIRILSGFPDAILAISGEGEVTPDDFRLVVWPALEAKLKTHKHLSLYYQLGPDFSGMSLGGMWEDTKLDIAHWNIWRRIAMVSDVPWIAKGMGLIVPLLHHRVRFFSNAEADTARAWLESV
jgi:SpoIIAA-like